MNETIYEIFEKYFKDFNGNDLKDCDLNNNGNISISTHIYKIVISNQIQNRCIRIYYNQLFEFEKCYCIIIIFQIIEIEIFYIVKVLLNHSLRWGSLLQNNLNQMKRQESFYFVFTLFKSELFIFTVNNYIALKHLLYLNKCYAEVK